MKVRKRANGDIYIANKGNVVFVSGCGCVALGD